MATESIAERAEHARQRLGTLGVSVEPMTPEHAAALVAFHARLSPDSTRKRYFSPHPHLTPAEVQRFTHVDHLDREALVALDGESNLIAVARLDRVAAGSLTAEVAFIVEDAWQHHGVGAAMFDLLVARACELGIRTLVAETLADNRAMQTVFRHGGWPMTLRSESGTTHVRIELPDR